MDERFGSGDPGAPVSPVPTYISRKLSTTEPLRIALGVRMLQLLNLARRSGRTAPAAVASATLPPSPSAVHWSDPEIKYNVAVPEAEIELQAAPSKARPEHVVRARLNPSPLAPLLQLQFSKTLLALESRPIPPSATSSRLLAALSVGSFRVRNLVPGAVHPELLSLVGVESDKPRGASGGDVLDCVRDFGEVDGHAEAAIRCSLLAWRSTAVAAVQEASIAPLPALCLRLDARSARVLYAAIRSMRAELCRMQRSTRVAASTPAAPALLVLGATVPPLEAELQLKAGGSHNLRLQVPAFIFSRWSAPSSSTVSVQEELAGGIQARQSDRALAAMLDEVLAASGIGSGRFARRFIGWHYGRHVLLELTRQSSHFALEVGLQLLRTHCFTITTLGLALLVVAVWRASGASLVFLL